MRNSAPFLRLARSILPIAALWTGKLIVAQELALAPISVMLLMPGPPLLGFVAPGLCRAWALSRLDLASAWPFVCRWR
jgi:hypothetical protein